MSRFVISRGALLTPLLIALPQVAAAASYYVSPTNGSNSHNGLSASTPFRTIQYAEGLTKPGDTVYLMNGTYTNDAPGDNVLMISVSGTAAAPITYTAYPGAHPVLSYSSSWAAILVAANYITISGLEIVGNAASVTPATAMAQMKNLANPATNGDGVDVEPASSSAPTVHHVTLQNLLVHDTPGGGIEVHYADYITLKGNVVYNTSHWSPYGDSGISVYEAKDIDSNTGYKISVLNNTTFNNSENVPCVDRQYKSISDGNGIIIDDNRHTQDGGVPYHGRTLVAYNVTFGNGGSGIHAFESQHVDILNNTAYGNDTIATPTQGQIFSNTGSDVNIVNNILESPAGIVTTSSTANTASVVEDYNLLWNASGTPLVPSVRGAHDIVANPLFANPTAGNFALEAASPARNSAEPAMQRTATMPATATANVTLTDRGAE